MNHPRLIIMAKLPLPGRSKTRLAPALGLRGAARVQARLLADRLHLARRSGLTTHVHLAPQARNWIAASARRNGLKAVRQHTGSLGQRMARAMRGAGPTIVIGTDCPALGTTQLAAVTASLQTHDAVLVPARDGGYVLLALRHPAPRVFAGIDWGSRVVMRQTLRQLRRLGLRTRIFPALDDLDTPADWRRLKRQGHAPALRRSPGA